jgi:CheY-like chemotaxis protein
VPVQMTIMLIDDDRGDHEIFQEVIRRLDPAHKCIKAFNGNTAMDMLLDEDRTLPDIIFLDLTLRVENGRDILKMLKDSLTLQDIPVSIYTGSTQESDVEITRSLGAIGFVQKQADLTGLKQSINSVLSSLNLSEKVVA